VKHQNEKQTLSSIHAKSEKKLNPDPPGSPFSTTRRRLDASTTTTTNNPRLKELTQKQYQRDGTKKR
jgi:hypothetical protein